MNWRYSYKQDHGDWPFRCVFLGTNDDHIKQRESIVDWCCEVFPSRHWFVQGRAFWFKEKEYAELFLLRWQ